MNTTTSTPISLPLPLSLPADLPSTARHALRHLQRLQHGTLHLELPDGTALLFGPGGHPHASLRLHDWQVFGAVLVRAGFRTGMVVLAEGPWRWAPAEPQTAEPLLVAVRPQR